MSWSVGGEKSTEIVVGDTGRILFGTCTCAFFQENLLGRGPCEHMLALFQASAEGRKDLPTSAPAVASDAAATTSRAKEADEPDADEEDFDDEGTETEDEDR